jgi:4-amino-4-deoxychorismate lyase
LIAPIAVWVNGSPALNGIDAMDRGLNYGDGLFETMRLSNGSIRFLDSHLVRLRRGCERLRMSCPETLLLEEINHIVGDVQDAVLKIVLTRGHASRGYRPNSSGELTRILSLHALPAEISPDALKLRWCTMRLSRNEALAGMKHLNRLEQVMAQSEWQPDEADEGLMLDTAGEVVCATAANIFIVRDQALVTPDLRYCGIEGVMRAQVIGAAERLQVPLSIEPVWPDDLADAREVFLTNAIRGIRSASRLEELHWSETSMASRLRGALKL